MKRIGRIFLILLTLFTMIMTSCCDASREPAPEMDEVYDRLGLEDQYTEILGVKVPMNTIPITPGRNLAMILEVAAMNNRQRRMGYNAALEFTEQINRHFDENIGKNK